MPAARKRAESKAVGHVVTGSLVQARVGDRVLHFHRGDVLPEGVSQESLEHLKSLGYVAEGSDPVGEDDQSASDN